MLRVKKNILFSIYHFYHGHEYFGTLKASAFKPLAKFIAQKGTYIFSREHFSHGSYFCRLETNQIAKADKPDGTGFSYNVRFRSISYIMKPGEPFHDRLELNYELYREDKLTGSIYQNYTRYNLVIDIKEDLPQVIQCFLFWLAFQGWVGQKSWSRMTLVWL